MTQPPATGPTVLGDGAAALVWADVPRPFVHPVRTPAGHALTVDAPADHPWHHALWFTIKFVDGDNFWEEYGDFGLLRQTAAPTLTHLGGVQRADSAITWVRPSGAVAIHEHRRVDHRVLAPDAWALDWRVALRPDHDCVLDRTPFTTWGGYGGLTLRGRPDWHDTALRLPDGEARERVLGDAAPWCALDGPLAEPDGDVEVGVVLLDHPANPRFPTPWYASTRAATYGDDGWSNFVNAAFLWDGPLEVAAGDALVLRHRVVVHDGTWDLDRLARAWDQWLTEADHLDRAAPDAGSDP